MSSMKVFLKKMAENINENSEEYRGTIADAMKYVETLYNDDLAKATLWSSFCMSMLRENDDLGIEHISGLGSIIGRYIPLMYNKNANVIIATDYSIMLEDCTGMATLIAIVPEKDGPELQSMVMVFNVEGKMEPAMIYDRGELKAIIEFDTDLSPVQEYMAHDRKDIFRRTYNGVSLEYDETYFTDENPEDIFLYDEKGKEYIEVYHDILDRLLGSF